MPDDDYRHPLADILAGLEANMDPAELAAHRARLARLMRVCDVVGPDVGVDALRCALDLTGQYRFTEALDLVLETIERA